MISRCAGGFERWVGFFMLLQVCCLKVSFKELLLNENGRMEVICVRQRRRTEVKVYFGGFEEWTIGEDGLIAQYAFEFHRYFPWHLNTEPGEARSLMALGMTRRGRVRTL